MVNSSENGPRRKEVPTFQRCAKILGTYVTAVDSAPKLEMLRTIGADRVVDYAQEDFTENRMKARTIITATTIDRWAAAPGA